MTDDNAPVVRHLQNAREHLAALVARREALQTLAEQWQANAPEDAAHEPTTPQTEADQ